ncbi:MAG: tRNA lysidine(34) synthetase TilS [Peptococcaceae bacterium]|nr:MAG: tRNA lysidine(34) synthetase TilS [Peptococcaceae bacterium]
MDIIEKVRLTIQRYQMVKQGDKVVVGVSGGADSVALLYILNRIRSELGISLHVAHLNHMMRGADADADAEFVSDLAGSYGLPVTLKRFDVLAYQKATRLSIQVAAREARYCFFQEVVDQVGAKRVALAHHADDQAETILMNFLRGTGLAGLKGILLVRDDLYIRPFLGVRRREIEAFCQSEGVISRQDISNSKQVYTRNRIRLHLLPLLEKEYNPALVSSLVRLGNVCQAEEEYLEAQANSVFQEALMKLPDEGVRLSLSVIKNQPVALQRRVLRLGWQALTGSRQNLSFRHVEAALALVENGSTGSYIVLPRGVKASKTYNSIDFLLNEKVLTVPFYVYPLAIPGNTYIPELNKTIYAAILPKDRMGDPKMLPPEEALINYDQVTTPLFVRRRRPGDVFRPYGLVSKVKLKDFLIKQKVPQAERDCIPLICTAEDIIWAAGVRLAENWKVTGEAARVLYLRLLAGQV